MSFRSATATGGDELATKFSALQQASQRGFNFLLFSLLFSLLLSFSLQFHDLISPFFPFLSFLSFFFSNLLQPSRSSKS